MRDTAERTNIQPRNYLNEVYCYRFKLSLRCDNLVLYNIAEKCNNFNSATFQPQRVIHRHKTSEQLTFHLLIQCTPQQHRHALHPLLGTEVTVVVFVKSSENW